MRTIFFFGIFITFASGMLNFTVSAQQTEEAKARYISEVKAYKHDFLSRDLELSHEQQKEFFSLYDELEDAILKLNNETRELEQEVSSDLEATDTEIEAATSAIFNQKVKEGQLELEYYGKFKEVLSPKQLLKLKSSERKFNQTLMKHHRRAMSNRRNASKQ